MSRYLLGIYNADGGVRGELRYLAGHLAGTIHCELCDITHSLVRRKKQWDSMVATLNLDFELVHRNEVPERLRSKVDGVQLPAVLLVNADAVTVLLDPNQLATCSGSVEEFNSQLQRALADAGT